MLLVLALMLALLIAVAFAARSYWRFCGERRLLADRRRRLHAWHRRRQMN